MEQILDENYLRRFLYHPKEFEPQIQGLFARAEEKTIREFKKKLPVFRNWRRAAEKKAEQKKHLSAAFLYQRAGLTGEGQKHFELAAKVLLKKGRYLESSYLLETHGRPSRAVRILETWLRANTDDSRDGPPSRRFRDCLYKAVELLLASGNHERASRLLMKYGYPLLAAHVLVRNNHPEQAGQILEKAGYVREAAEVYRQGGKEGKSHRMLAEEAANRGDILGSARWYRKTGDYIMAAQQLETLKRWQEAAEAYEKAGNLQHAARCYRRIPDLEAAASLLTRAGKWIAAADIRLQQCRYADAGRCFERSREYYRAGEAFFKARDFESAVRNLQNVPGNSPDRHRALRRLAQTFLEEKKPELVISKLGNTADYQKSGKPDLELVYYLGRAYEDKMLLKEARAAYRSILSRDSDFRDVRSRLKETGKSAREILLIRSRQQDPTIRYEKVQELGEGGMGRVYLAHDLHLKRPVALKILKEGTADPRESLRIFRREARAVAALSHPNIVKIFDFGQINQAYFIAMEYLEGRDLFTIMCERGGQCFTIGEVLSITTDILKAMSYAHQQGIIHRDIKPHNLLLSRGQGLKIMDFGIAAILGQDLPVPEQYTLGSPHYMSPEQIRGAQIDHRADIYSLGITLFQILTGEPPFQGREVLRQQMQRVIPDPRELRPDIPPPLCDLIRKCTRKKPAHRYPTAGMVLKDLTGINSGITAAPPLGELSCYRRTHEAIGRMPGSQSSDTRLRKSRNDRFQTRIPRLPRVDGGVPESWITERLDPPETGD